MEWWIWCSIESYHILHMGNMKRSYKNNEFKISGLISNTKFELPAGSYCVLDIQDHFEYVKRHEITLVIL